MKKPMDDCVVGFEVTEFFGSGDPMFGGAADDRPLGNNGQFLRGCFPWSDVAQFATREQAQAAADAAEQRPGGKVGIIPVRDFSLMEG